MHVSKRSAIAVCLLPLVFATSSSYAAPHNNSGGSSAVAPCVMSDFVGDAPYPQGMGPFTDIGYPQTGEAVTGRVYVQQGSYSGLWLGDPMVGSIVKIELYVDGSLVATQDLTARKTGALLWNASVKGTHDLMLRMYSTNYERTKQCYVDSPHQYPIAI